MFRSLYGPTLLESLLFGDTSAEEDHSRAMSPIETKLLDFAREQIRAAADKGGYVEGLARIALLMFEARGWFDERSLRMADQVLPHDERLRQLSDEEINQIVEAQSYIVWLDHDLALKTLPALLSTAEDREAATNLFASVRMVSGELTPAEETMAREICDVLGVKIEDAA